MTALVTRKAEVDAHSDERPFKPLFTIRRGGRIEVTVYGIVSVVTGIEASPIMATGDTTFELWSRSLLKPWQLLTNFQILKDNYPALTDEHYALCMASHSGEAGHIRVLEEILAITGVDESYLKCPPASPVDLETKELMKERGEKPRRRYHNCSGKHSSFLAAVKATQGADKMKDYLADSEAHHVRLKGILSALCRRPAATFTPTTDGCQLANYALSAAELSYLYMTLLNPGCLSGAAREQAIFAPYGEIGQLMLKHPRMVSGRGRLDYKIMSREIFTDCPSMVAKEGADGLLGIGVAAIPSYPNGLGIAIKLSAGFDSHHMELITREILSALGLTSQSSKVVNKSNADTDAPITRTDHIQTEFHFLEDIKQINLKQST
jgi:L-asparaginase II